MKIKNYEILTFIQSGQYEENTYLFINLDSKDCFIVDPGFGCQELIMYINKNSLKLNFIYITHGHFDHWSGTKEILDSLGNIKIYYPEKGIIWFDKKLTNSDFFISEFEGIKNGTIINFKSLKLEVIETPGHSLDSTTIFINKLNLLVCGDLLFFRSIGRTDFIHSNPDALINSITLLYESFLDYNPHCLPGHGISTTLKDEYENNPFVSKKNLRVLF